MPLPLQSLTPEALQAALPIATLPEARKIVSAVHRDEPIERPIAEVRRVTMDALRAGFHVPTLEVHDEVASALDPFRKLVLRTPAGELVETVRIPLEKPGRFSVCVSSQVGCALACAFCATGRMGLRRNLETWEIVEQVRHVRRTLGEGQRVHGVVFQGMGEPLANLSRVVEAVHVLSEPSALQIDGRAITVCTSGLPTGIRRLARELPKVRLGISIGSALPGARAAIMPIDRSHPFEEVLDAAVEHARITGHSPMWAVTLLEGVNDGEEHAIALADAVLRFTERSGIRPRVSVIPYNEIGDDPFRRASTEREDAFRAAMRARGVGTHKRYSGGGDVAAACGQLAAQG